MKFEMKKKHWFAMGIILIASAAFRIIPHPLNFAPLAGMALLGSAYIKESWKAWLLPVGAFWLSDLVLNNLVYAQYYEGFVLASQPFLFSAAAMLLIVLIGKVVLKKTKLTNLVIASLMASIIFFLVSNFGSWAQGIMPYSRDFTGILEAYVAGLPFLKGTMVGDLLFTGVLFGAWHLLFIRQTDKSLAVERS